MRPSPVVKGCMTIIIEQVVSPEMFLIGHVEAFDII